MKLSPEQRSLILAEMTLAESFNTKRWSQHYKISPRTVKRLRAAAREALAAEKARKGPPAEAVLAEAYVTALAKARAA